VYRSPARRAERRGPAGRPGPSLRSACSPCWSCGRRTREALDLVDLWDVRGRRAGRLSTAADAELNDGTLDLVIVAPEDPEATLRAGEQSVFEVVIGVVDPIQVNFA